MDEAPVHQIEERLPWRKHLLHSFQFLFVLTEIWLYPLLIGGALGMSGGQITGLMSVSLLCGAVLTIAYAWKPLGVGLFLPSSGAADLLTPLLVAASIGGMALMATMSVLAGLLQILVTPLIRQFKVIVRPTLVALVMVIMAFWLASLGIHQLLGAQIGQIRLHTLWKETLPPFDLAATTIGILSLFLMSLLRFSRFRNWGIMVGALFGWVVLALFDRLSALRVEALAQASWYDWPKVTFEGFQFERGLILPTALAVVYLVVILFAKVTSLQWSAKEVGFDMRTVRRANLISGIGVVVAGFLGAVPQTCKVEGTAMEQASGIFVRVTAYFYAALLVIIAFCPKLMALLATIPGQVNGAILLMLSASALSMGLPAVEFRKIPMPAAKSFALATLFGVMTMVNGDFYIPLLKINLPAAFPGLMGAIIVFFVCEIFFFGLAKVGDDA